MRGSIAPSARPSSSLAEIPIAHGYPCHHRSIVVIRGWATSCPRARSTVLTRLRAVRSRSSATTSTMPVHTVSANDTLFTIAKQHGFRNWRASYDHPRNEGLPKQRPDPMLLASTMGCSRSSRTTYGRARPAKLACSPERRARSISTSNASRGIPTRRMLSRISPTILRPPRRRSSTTRSKTGCPLPASHYAPRSRSPTSPRRPRASVARCCRVTTGWASARPRSVATHPMRGGCTT